MRDEAAEKNRARIVAAAVKILLSRKGASGFSLDAVAKAARVTRLTIYNQFGSRRALLEAVFDDRAARGGLHRLAAAMALADPQDGLRRFVAIFCDFWSAQEGAIARLRAVGGVDAAFARTIRARNERRRQALAVLIDRIVPKMATSTRRELVDTLFALTSHGFFAELRSGGLSAERASALVESLVFGALAQK